MRILLAFVPEDVCRRSIVALGSTGMRADEATTLRVGDVDFKRGVIRISRSLSPGKHGELIVQSPKSHKSREVPIIEVLRPCAEEAASGRQAHSCSQAPTAVGSPTTTCAGRSTGEAACRDRSPRPANA